MTAYRLQWNFWLDDWVDIGYFKKGEDAAWQLTNLSMTFPTQTFRIIQDGSIKGRPEYVGG